MKGLSPRTRGNRFDLAGEVFGQVVASMRPRLIAVDNTRDLDTRVGIALKLQ